VILNWSLMRNPLNWCIVGLMSIFFFVTLREILRLFEKDDTTANKVL
jgi:hypothetical protein